MQLSFEQQLRANDTELLFATKTVSGQYSIEALSANGNTINYGTYSSQTLESLYGKEYAEVIIKKAVPDKRIRLTKEDLPSIPDVTKNPEFRKELLMDAATSWGYTNNPQEAAFMLPNGKMLDFSDKIYDESGVNHRNNDHSTIKSGINHFMELGAIRLLPEVGGFELVFKPTPEQVDALKEYLRVSDFAREEGSFVAISKDCNRIGRNEVASIEFPVGTNPDEIFETIEKYNLISAPEVEFNNQDFIENRLIYLSEEVILNNDYSSEDMIDIALKIINNHDVELKYSRDTGEFMLFDSQGEAAEISDHSDNDTLYDVIQNIYWNYSVSSKTLEDKLLDGDYISLTDDDVLLYTFANNPVVKCELEQITSSSLLDRGYDIEPEPSNLQEL